MRGVEVRVGRRLTVKRICRLSMSGAVGSTWRGIPPVSRRLREAWRAALPLHCGRSIAKGGKLTSAGAALLMQCVAEAAFHRGRQAQPDRSARPFTWHLALGISARSAPPWRRAPMPCSSSTRPAGTSRGACHAGQHRPSAAAAAFARAQPGRERLAVPARQLRTYVANAPATKPSVRAPGSGRAA
jgi:hypothetical protein